MDTVTLQDLRRDPAALLARVEAGERLFVSRDGRAVAELRPVVPSPGRPRPFGLAAGEVSVPENFDAPLPEEILRDFEAR